MATDISVSESIGEVAVIPAKLEKAQLYLSKELRKILGWKTEEQLVAIASSNILVLFKDENYGNLVEPINKAIEKLNEIKKKL